MLVLSKRINGSTYHPPRASQLILMALILFLPLANAHGGANNDKKFGYSARYGIVTPSQVFQLNMAINQTIMFFVKERHPELLPVINTMTAQTFQDKTPEDVFQAIQKLANQVDRRRAKVGLPAIPRVQKEGAKAIPAEVFLATGNILDGFVGYLAKQFPGKPLGGLYRVDFPKDSKTPSDVFSRIDLTIRQMEQLEKVL